MKNSIDFDQSLLVKLIALKAVVWLSSCAVLTGIHQYFDLELPFGTLVWALVLSAAVIAAWLIRLKFRFPVTELEVTALLFSDLLSLSLLIEFSGGSANPFTSSMLVPLALGAALLKKQYSLPLIVLAVLIYARWTFLGDAHHHMDHANFSLHLYGMWINFALSAVILFVFITYATDSVRARDEQLHSAREKILRDEQLVAVATLTASTAHALGSPLSSMTILLEEWEREGIDGDEIEIFKQELRRCRGYLASIGEATKDQKIGEKKRVSVSSFYNELQQHYQLLRPEADLKFEIDPALESNEIIKNNSLVLALVNIVDNAIEARSEQVKIIFSKFESRLKILVLDNGKGLSDEMKIQLGKTFIDSSKGGWGMGVYLSHSTIEQFGGEISMLDGVDGGTEIRILLPMENG